MASRDYPITKIPFHSADLEEVATVLQKGLKDNFKNVDVAVVDCPDLTQKPFQLVGKGIGGDPCLVDIGGNPYLLPVVHRDKTYDLEKVAKQIGRSGSMIVGSGCGPSHVLGTNCEMIANLRTAGPNSPAVNQSRSCTYNERDGSYTLKPLAVAECAIMMNLFISDGKPGKVVRVRASHRTGESNFMLALRTSLAKHYGTQPVGLGGVFVIEKGKAKIHVMPDFAKEPLLTKKQVYDEFLKFFEMKAPLTCVGYAISHDPGYAMRMDHFHCFSDHGDGGRYHFDTTPEEVSYLAYFNVPDCVYRVDQPTEKDIK